MKAGIKAYHGFLYQIQGFFLIVHILEAVKIQRLLQKVYQIRKGLLISILQSADYSGSLFFHLFL
jgi:hypothetical protein